MDIKKLSESISMITEPQRQWGNVRHNLEDILIIGLCSVICLGEDYADMELFGNERIEWFKTFLELPNGIPDKDTFRGVFQKALKIVDREEKAKKAQKTPVGYCMENSGI